MPISELKHTAASIPDATAGKGTWFLDLADDVWKWKDENGVVLAIGASSAPVQSVFGRTGAVTALQADYDAFFLTPAEGDAAYLAKGSLTDGSVLFAASGQVAQDNANLFWYSTEKKLSIGTDTHPGVINSFSEIDANVFWGQYAAAGSGGPTFFGRKSRGTIAAPAIVQDADNIIMMRGQAWDGGAWREAGRVVIQADGTPASGSMPTLISFQTVPAGSTTSTERMRLANLGSLILGTAVSTTPLAIGGLTVYGAASQKTAVFRANATTPGNIIDLQRSDGVSRFSVSAAGLVTMGDNDLTVASNLITGGGGANVELRAPTGFAVKLGVTGSTAPLTAAAASLTVAEAVDFNLGTTTGTKFGTGTAQKLSLWNATPIVQPTTAVAAATFVANTSGIANDTATFDGYTIGQVVKALRNMGALA